jgi:hypothetical protein
LLAAASSPHSATELGGFDHGVEIFLTLFWWRVAPDGVAPVRSLDCFDVSGGFASWGHGCGWVAGRTGSEGLPARSPGEADGGGGFSSPPFRSPSYLLNGALYSGWDASFYRLAVGFARVCGG